MNGNKLLVGAGVGVAMAYLFDPSRGRRRRALLNDQFRRASRKTRDAIDTTTRDMKHRASGMVASTRGRFTRRSPDPATLTERVRAKLGRVCSHPKAVEVDGNDGHVTLRGDILAHEVRDLLAAVATVPGVRTVSNQLQAHDSGEGVPSLQGGRSLTGSTLDILQRTGKRRAVVTAMGFAATGLCLAAYARRH
jgi:gas vesicle protein